MTVSNKELKVRKLPQGQIYNVYFEGGGELPASLKGRYTKQRFAEKAIEDYLKSKEKKPKKSKKVKDNGKDKTATA